MNHEKTFKRPDGTKYNIVVSFYESLGKAIYTVGVYKCEPRKRIFRQAAQYHDYEFRRLSMPDRENFLMSEYLKHVTESEIMEVKNELWQKLKP